MRAPVRWSEQASGSPLKLRRALEREQLDGPSTAQLARIEQRVRSVLTTTAVPAERGGDEHASTAGAGAGAGHGIAIKIVGAVVLASIVSIAALRWGSDRGASIAKPVAPPAPALVAPASSGRPATPAPAASAAAAPAENAPAPRAPAPERREAPRKKRSPTQLRPSVGELELLARARAALTAAPVSALTLVYQHEHDFPNGTFREEREALRIEALIALARTDEARTRAATFRQRFPKSAYLRRITRLFADPDAQGAHRR